MRRRGVLVGAWVVATAVATLIAWGAVGRVTDQVSPPPVLPLPTAVALADEPQPPTASPAAQSQQRAGDPPKGAGRDRQPQRERKREQRQQAAQPASPPAPPADAPAQEQGDPAAPAESAPRAVTQSYDLEGGTVTVRYRSGATHLVEATPDSGFDLDVNDAGPGKVDVRFRSDRHESRLVTRWDEGGPDPQTEERPR